MTMLAHTLLKIISAGFALMIAAATVHAASTTILRMVVFLRPFWHRKNPPPSTVFPLISGLKWPPMCAAVQTLIVHLHPCILVVKRG